MRTVNPKSSSSYSLRRGFTLFEIVVVIGLALLISGIGAFYISAPQLEEELRSQHAKVEDFVMQARSLSISYQQPFVVRFKEGRVQMEPKARPEVASADDYDLGEPPSSNLRPLATQPWPREEKFDGEYLVEIRRWGKDDFIAITERSEEEWIFDPNGLCEPIAVRISSDEGLNTITRVFHPLTGLAQDEAVSLAGD